LVHVTALDQADPAHLLLGLGERPVGEQQLAAADPDGLALGRRPQPAAALQHATFGHPLTPPEAALVRVRRGALVPPDQQQVSHHSSLPHCYDESPGLQSPLPALLLTACLRIAPRIACMPITRDEVAHLARLSRIALSEAELDHLAPQLDQIIPAVAQVHEVAAERLPPTSHATGLTNVYRDDEPGPCLTPAEALDQ